MPLINYRAVDSNGKTQKGSLNARNIEDAKAKIKDLGLTAVKVSAGSAGLEKLKGLMAKKVNLKETAMFCRQLHIIVSSGVNILKGIDILRKQTKDKLMKEVIGKMFAQVQKGRLLSEAMSDVEASLPPLLLNMVAVGEVSGNLDRILNQMSVYYEKENYMRQKLKSALTYPVILISVGVLMGIFFINFVLPEIMKVVIDNGGELPQITRIVLGGINFLKQYFLIIIIGLIGAIALLKAVIPKDKFRMVKDRLIMKLPVVNVSIRNVVTSRFLRTFAMMLKGGIPIIRVLESLETIMGNAIAQSGIKAALEGVKRGERLGDNIASCEFFDPIVIHMINMGEETGGLDNIMETLADFYDKEAETGLMKLMAAVEPAFTIIVGILIGILIIAMMLPMFSMMNNVNGGI